MKAPCQPSRRLWLRDGWHGAIPLTWVLLRSFFSESYCQNQISHGVLPGVRERDTSMSRDGVVRGPLIPGHPARHRPEFQVDGRTVRGEEWLGPLHQTVDGICPPTDKVCPPAKPTRPRIDGETARNGSARCLRNSTDSHLPASAVSDSQMGPSRSIASRLPHRGGSCHESCPTE